MELEDSFGSTYEVKEVLGENGLLRQVLGEDPVTGKQFLVQEYRDDGHRHPVLQVSMDSVRELVHPMLPAGGELHRDGSGLYYVCEHVTGTTLAEILKEKGPAEEKQVLGWFRDLAGLLMYLDRQEEPLTLRGLTLSGLVLTEDGQLRLASACPAAAYGQGDLPAGQPAQNCEIPGPAFVRSYYDHRRPLIPEAVTPRHDIRELGSAMYTMLTGVKPEDRPETPARHYRPDLSRQMNYILERCLPVLPEDAYQSLESLMLDLERAERSWWKPLTVREKREHLEYRKVAAYRKKYGPELPPHGENGPRTVQDVLELPGGPVRDCGLFQEYEAVERATGARVLVREYRKQTGSREMALNVSLEVMNLINHPLLPRGIRFFEDSESLCMVQELVEGKTLEEYLKEEGPVPESDALMWFVELADMEDYLSSLPLPLELTGLTLSSLVLEENGSIRVKELGPACEYLNTVTGETETPEGPAVSTVRGGTRCPWTLGTVIYAVLTGRTMESADMISEEEMFAVINRAASPGLARILCRCLSDSLDCGWDTAGELLSDLQRLELASGTLLIGLRDAPVVPERKKRRVSPLMLAAAGAAAGAVLLALIRRRKKQQPSSPAAGKRTVQGIPCGKKT